MNLLKELRDCLCQKLISSTPGKNAWLAKNVLCQNPEMPLSDFLRILSKGRQIKRFKTGLIHIVNLYSLNGGIDQIQRYTVESMWRAASEDSNVVLINVQSASDPDLTPGGFVRSKDLTRNIMDIKPFEVSRNFPLLFDVLECGIALSASDDYIIYTNADIMLSQRFYGCIRDLVGDGADALTINRRNIGAIESFPRDSCLATAEVGLNDPSFDCLVCRRRLWDLFAPSRVCLGIDQVTRSLLYNMVAHSKLILMLKNVSLTTHFGDDRPWRADIYGDYSEFNTEESLLVLRALNEESGRCVRDFCCNHPETPTAIEVVSRAIQS